MSVIADDSHCGCNNRWWVARQQQTRRREPACDINIDALE